MVSYLSRRKGPLHQEWLDTYKGVIDLPAADLKALVEGSLQNAMEGPTQQYP